MENIEVKSEPTRDDVVKLLQNMLTEYAHLQSDRGRLRFRVARLEDITGRVKFLKRKSKDQSKFIRRLTAANRELRSTLADINSFETEIKRLRTSLGE